MVKTVKSAAFMALLVLLNHARADWDDPPLVNTVQASTGVVSLNFGSQGSRQQIAIFVVNSNDPAGFHIDFTFANKGLFKSGTRTFAMSGVMLDAVGGTLGPGLTPLNDLALTVDGTTGIATWSPGGTPTGATEDFVIAIYANWADQSALLAGFYQENISAVVVSGP
jgi:hypothetical protein